MTLRSGYVHGPQGHLRSGYVPDLKVTGGQPGSNLKGRVRTWLFDMLWGSGQFSAK